MHFPRYWARGSYEDFVCWGHSDRSEEEAARNGAESARSVADRYRRQELPGRKPDYGYGNGFLREEVLREIARDGDALQAALTRNALGCLVINSSEALFVDIDLPEQKKSGGFFQALFGKKSSTPEPLTPKEKALRNIEQFARRNTMSARVYETKAGLRVLFTHDVFRPKSSEVQMVFESLQADPLYTKLCQRQESFRARVSPKPWRCGDDNRPPSWPYGNDDERRRFEDWLANYEKLASGFATCRFLQTFGPNRTHERIGPIVEIHDELSRAGLSLPLA